MVFEKVRIFLEKRALLGLFDISLELHRALLAGVVEKLVEQLQMLKIERLGIFPRQKHANCTLADGYDDEQWIGNQDGAERRPADDQQFGRLQQDKQVAVLHEVAAHHGAE